MPKKIKALEFAQRHGVRSLCAALERITFQLTIHPKLPLQDFAFALFLLFLLPTSRAATSPRQLGPFGFLSHNGRYHLSVLPAELLLSTDPNQILLTSVANFSTNRLDILWTNYFSGIQFPPENPNSIILSDDGTCFVAQADRDRWKLVSKGQPSRTLVLNKEPSRIRWGFIARDNCLAYFDKFDAKPIVRIWQRDSDIWKAYFVQEDQELATTPKLIAQWNSDTRENILDEIAKTRADSLKKKLYDISPTLGAMADDKRPRWFRPRPRTIHYEFLAERHVPKDRAIFEDLLQHKAVGPVPTNIPPMMRARINGFSILTGAWHSRSQGIDSYTFESISLDRREGDELLAVFDQRPAPKHKNEASYEKDLFYLGRLKGSVQLPLPIVNKSGILRIYLVPVDRADKDWDGDGIDKIEEQLIQETRWEAGLTDKINFIYDTVTPGRVRLKAIWDKRPHFDDLKKSGPGDYETDWTPPITITAGATITNVLLICTNRAQGGETYYAADEQRARNWREQGEAAFSPSPKIPAEKTEMFSAPAANWKLETNFQVPGRNHGLFQISIVHESIDTSKTPELLAIFAKATGKNSGRIIDPYTLRLLDKGGTEFIPTHTRTSAQFTYATFPDFPRAAETFRLLGYGRPENSTQDHSTNALFDLTLTNLTLHVSTNDASAVKQ